MIEQTIPFLSMKEVESKYSSGFHLGPLSFALNQGDFASLIGPNGSGKSTLFKTIAGDLHLLKGKIEMNGVDFSALSSKEKAQRVAVVTTGIQFPAVEVSEMVMMGRLPHQKGMGLLHSEKDKEIVEEVMKRTGITPLRHHIVSQLSAGQQQLVAVATALAQQPQLLLLDEATAHLDITHQIQLMNLLQKMNEEEGLTILMILHDLNLASEYCNPLFLMQGGKIIVHGAPHEVLRYNLLEEIYRTPVVVSENPFSHLPFVLPISAKAMKGE